MEELCTFFQISRPAIYDWINHGKLKSIKIRLRFVCRGVAHKSYVRYLAFRDLENHLNTAKYFKAELKRLPLLV